MRLQIEIVNLRNTPKEYRNFCTLPFVLGGVEATRAWQREHMASGVQRREKHPMMIKQVERDGAKISSLAHADVAPAAVAVVFRLHHKKPSSVHTDRAYHEVDFRGHRPTDLNVFTKKNKDPTVRVSWSANTIILLKNGGLETNNTHRR